MSTYDRAMEFVWEVVDATTLVTAAQYDDEEGLAEEYEDGYNKALKELKEFLKENLKESKPKRKKPMTKQEATDFLISVGVFEPDRKLIETIEFSSTIYNKYTEVGDMEPVKRATSLRCWSEEYHIGEEIWVFTSATTSDDWQPYRLDIFERVL